MPLPTKEQQIEYQRNWMLERRAHYVAMFGGKCWLCGSTEELEFDHADPSTKSLATGGIWSRREEVILSELSKCSLLCKVCHGWKTRLEGLTRSLHGGAGAYEHGCRCPDCVEYNRSRKRGQRVQPGQEDAA